MKKKLDGLVAAHSLFHSRKTAVPEYFEGLDPGKLELSRHCLVQKHEWSGRMVSTTSFQCETQGPDFPQNLYIASYVHHIECLAPEESRALIKQLLDHISKPKYRYTAEWVQDGDMMIWDNTCVMHRATGGSYEGKYPRDMRRTTVKDMSSSKFGLNGEGADWRVGLP